MTKRKVWRYYCEFCKRSGCSGGHIAMHEKSCTANPNRVCGFCTRVGENQAPIPELIAALMSHGDDLDAGIKALRELANACPGCMLAAIRQSGVQKASVVTGQPGFEYEEHLHVPFDFRAECASWWRDTNGAEVGYDGGPY